MKVAIACGGTGGHFFPGLATAEVLTAHGHDVALWLTGRSIEASAAAVWVGPVITVPAEGLPAKLSPRGVRAGWRLLRAVRWCTRIMRAERPEVLLATGSYASVGPAAAAWRLRVPYVLHESNAVPGRAVSLLARRAQSVAACFESLRFHLGKADVQLTGMPLRKELENGRRQQPKKPNGSTGLSVLVMGGSAGAASLNRTVTAALRVLSAARSGIEVIHLTGEADAAWVREAYQREHIRHEVHAFTSDMAGMYSRADLVICRSGAATCAELAAFGLPSLLVPYPYATRDHQTANAHELQRLGAADYIPESDLSEEWLVEYLLACMDDRQRLQRLSAQSAARWQEHAAERLAAVVLRAARSDRARRAAP